MGGLYYNYGDKYFLLSSWIVLGISRGFGIVIKKAMEKNNAGGTTPYKSIKNPSEKNNSHSLKNVNSIFPRKIEFKI